MRQAHGFLYENFVIKKYNLLKTKNYHDVYDAYYKDIPIQIKCMKYGCSIDLSSYARNKNKKEDFIMIIGFWQKEKTNIVKEHILFINHKLFVKNMTFDFDNVMLKELKMISNNKEDDFKWKIFCNKYKKCYPKSNLIKLRFKRDHKSQKRIQCGISWKTFNEKFLKLTSIFNLEN